MMLRVMGVHHSSTFGRITSVSSVQRRCVHSSPDDSKLQYRQSRLTWLASSSVEKQGAIEDGLFDTAIAYTKSKWASPLTKFEGIRRPYSAESVVSKQGTLDTDYPSSRMAIKLASLLHEKAAKREPIHTCKLDHAEYCEA